MEVRTITIDPSAGPVELAVAEAGVGGRPLVLVHGFTGAKEDFTDGFDSMSDCLEDVHAGDTNGVVFLWDGWSPLARHYEQAFKVALSILGGRVNAERGGKFAAILRGEGPPIDLPELPHKH